MSDFAEFVYWLLAFPTFKGVVFGGLLLGLLVPAVLELLNWRRG